MNKSKQGHCPKCGSDNLVYEQVVFEGDTQFYFPFFCENCGNMGTENYTYEYDESIIYMDDEEVNKDE